jgi:hypothetical protein
MAVLALGPIVVVQGPLVAVVVVVVVVAGRQGPPWPSAPGW